MALDIQGPMVLIFIGIWPTNKPNKKKDGLTIQLEKNDANEYQLELLVGRTFFTNL